MKTVEFSKYYLPGLPGKKPHASRWAMSPEEAEKHGALGKVPGTSEFRQVPDTPEEEARSMVNYQSAGHDSVQPPRKHGDTE